jgi:cytoskeletal protein CcmA (bactofilin family)
VVGNVSTHDGESGTLVISEQARVGRRNHRLARGRQRRRERPGDGQRLPGLQSKAKIVGDVEYRTLEMHLGAVVQGRLLHVEPGTCERGRIEESRGE